ncbi:hypothetical protein MWU75_14345 [Ornithinimicrobium sp. F0845]|uniref:SpaA isopeptide-forming pilin-related protein n=1 Tax=Ornithinimicrobium sp. F0845 TaxID=2926412 RepID=UPI001FF0E926|nr:SpaA isopeptide-forming pilin-related protein [Ornithinimicrobium sp. F0845]MCK0113326.1 hypothetical protein [Ornithinimicrobium sp. F0845]
MRHRRSRPIAPTPVRKAAVGVAALAVVLSGAIAAPGAIAETTTDEQATGSLTWFAADDAGSAVAETTFEVAGPDGMERPVVDNDGQDSNTTAGTITLDGLPVGDYTITQVAAPEGYEFGAEPQQVVVTEQGQQPAVPITFVNAAVGAEDESGDEGADEGEAEDGAADEGAREGGESDAPEAEVPEEGADEPAEAQATEDDAVVEDGAEASAEESTEVEADGPLGTDAEADVVATPAALPPGPPASDQANILVRKGGDRVGTSTTVTPLAGASFEFFRVGDDDELTGGTSVGTCTTAPGDNGVCGIQVNLPNYDDNYFYVVETSAPSGWTAPLTWGSDTQYMRYNTGEITRGGGVDSRIVTLPGTNRTFPDVRDNPEPPAQCGLKVALVYDLSNSVTDSDSLLEQYKAAGVGFVDALEGTPSSIALYTFATNAPADGFNNGSLPLTSVATSGDAVRNHINAFGATPQNAQGGTNWDMGLAQVDAAAYDAVIFLTDGTPTFHRDGSGPGNTSTIREVEEAIHSANKIKAATSLIVVGIGAGVTGDTIQKRLSLLSSTSYTSDFDELEEFLRSLALANCLGTLTVVKQERALDGTLSPGEDWTFSTADDEVTPASGETNQDGAINFEVDGYSDTVTTRDITVTETQQPGFSLEQQNGFNAVCSNTATGQPVASTNSGALGFTVPVPSDGAISCRVINNVHPTVTLQKSWVDGLTGDSATLTINGQPTDPPVVSEVGDTPTFVDTDNVVTVPVTAGESVTVAEVLAGAGAYATDLSCDGVNPTYTEGDLSGSFTMPDGNVLCTFTNSQELVDLEVSKTVDTSYDRTYTWSIDKVADPVTVNTPEGQQVTVEYDVTVTAEDMTDSNVTVSGTITVTNENAMAFTGVDVSDSLPGAECTVTNGTGVTVPADGEVVLNYECTAETIAAVGDTNTAEATWDAASYPGTTGTATGTGSVAFGDPDSETDRVVTVNDAFDGAAAELLPLDGDPVELDWVDVTADGGSYTFSYEREIAGVAGTCTTYPNVATIVETDQSGEADVQVCVGTDLTVAKNVVVSMDRSYSYDLDKDVDQTQLNVDPTTGEATFAYTVTVTDGPSADSNWQMTGEITVTNGNDWPVMADVTDTVDNGGVCTVTGGEDATIPANDSAVLDYSCTFDTQPAYDGTNTATVTWDADEYFSPSGSATGTAAFAAGDWSVTPINDTVTIVDDKTDPANPVVLGEHTWTGEGNTEDFTYNLTLAGEPGECVDFTNTAWLQELSDVSAEQEVTVCWPLDLTVEKTVDADFDREYFWLLDKEADQTEVTITDGGSAEFNYVVSATPNGYEDSGWTMSGTITVDNPNSTAVTADLTDDPAGLGTDVTCEVADAQVVVPAGGSVSTTYTCTIDGQPTYTGGTNTATASWTVDGVLQTASSAAEPVEFTVDEETNVEVQVWDDKVTGEAPGDLLGTADWHDGVTKFEYSLEFEGVAGECTDYTNTAVIPMTGDEASETVTVCVELGPEVSKIVNADYDRQYFWDIQKEADQTEVTITEGGSAEFDYVVSAIPDGFADSGWAMSGQITVTNPNDFSDLTVTVTDVATVGGTCTVVDGEDVVVPAGGSVDLDYDCSFTEEPDYQGTNTATATWTDAAGAEQSTDSGPVDVVFEIDEETDATVEVYDDKVTGVAPGELLGTATWQDGVTEFEYSLEFDGVAGTCTGYTNTAVIPATGDETEETVTVCVEAAPEVSKTAEADFDRQYFWMLDKDVDETSVEITDTEATFSYTVTATPDGFEDSGWAMGGQITVTNPNDFSELSVTVTDVATVGGTCTVADGEAVVIGAGATEVFDYVCTFTEEPDYEGTNTAYVAWTDAADMPQSTTSDPVDVLFEIDEETDLTVEVYDDKVTGVAPGELLGTATWNAESAPTAFTYDLTLPGVEGQCVDHTNTAVIPATGDDAEQTVTICVEDELVITKTAQADFDREYFWAIDKEADRTQVTIGEGDTAEFNYVVSAIADGFEDSNWAMSGQITVTNPNEYDEGTVTVEVTDTTDVGGTCEVVDGEGVVLAPGATQVFDYVCTFEEQPDYEGSNVATVMWTGPDGTERTITTDPVDVLFELDGETNLSVDVHDDKVTGVAPGELLGTADWHDGTTEFAYSMEFEGVPGQCVDYTNTAVILASVAPTGGVAPLAVGDEAEETVTVCVELAPEVSKTAVADFDREYFWQLTKEVDRTEAVVEDGALAEFNYTVTATPDGFADSGWAMSGQITVTNPNDFQEMTVTVTDLADVGGTCEVAGGQEAVIAAGATVVLDYTCSFTEQPAYEGSNTAHVAWTDADGVDRSTASDPVDVAFELDEETNLEVQVSDDLVTQEAPGELLGTAVWNADGTPTEFTYSLSFGGEVGETTYYTNTAVIVETGDTDDVTVEVTVPKPAPPEPPVIPTGDPVSGGSQWALIVAGITAMILALLGAGAMLWRRREQ